MYFKRASVDGQSTKRSKAGQKVRLPGFPILHKIIFTVNNIGKVARYIYISIHIELQLHES